MGSRQSRVGSGAALAGSGLRLLMSLKPLPSRRWGHLAESGGAAAVLATTESLSQDWGSGVQSRP